MDAQDYRIIDMLQRDGRATQLEIARAVGLSQPAVAERIRKLEERRVITGYTARVDATKLGNDITAFIGVNIEHPKYFENFAQKVLTLPEVLEAHRVAGQDSYILKVRTANTRTLDQLLVETLRTISGVTRTNTTIVLTSIKEETLVQPSAVLLKGD
ncbi:Lrp/AsnC family transcriptional regulator [Hyalangium rubrum]|uniref:Lrp/AsnC family transcriptional regulator n=1 Tax=Hyalangium rubrum TaxID=3103134 RepID=A0ABU5HA54_9BACT|nr:Lrp/AsnC family transcriptional regulator [Hyalangium sp. s54d21]MDY7230373.1 Lrp/AsnC family transcriptional regulator [Hyalangium sp. s54d21]